MTDKCKMNVLLWMTGAIILTVCPFFYDAFMFGKWSAAVLGAVFFLFSFSENDFQVFKKNDFIQPALLFGVISAVSITGSINPWAGGRDMVAFFVFLVWFFASSQLGSSESSRIQWARVVTYTAFVIAAMAAAQITGYLKDPASPFDPYTTMGHRNFTAEFLMMAVPISIYYFSSRFRKTEQYAVALAVILELLLLVLISCRSSWLGLAGALLVVLLMKTSNIAPDRRKSAILMGCLVLLTGIALISSSSLRDRLLSIRDVHHGTNRFRVLVWKSTIEMIKTHPVRGAGAGNFRFMYPLYRSEEEIALSGPDVFVDHAHNEYLEILSETGIAGAWALVWFILLFYRQISRNNKLKGEQRMFAVASCASVSALLVNSFFTHSLHNPVPLFLTAFLTGAVFSNQSDKKTTPSIIQKRTVLLSKIAGAALLCLWIWMLIYMIQISTGLHYDRKNNWNKAAEHYKKALILWPVNETAAYRRSYCSLKSSRNDEAIEDCRIALKRHPEFQNAWYNLAVAYDRSGQTELAESAYIRTLKLNPLHQQSWNNLGIMYQKTGKSFQAESSFLKAIEIDPLMLDAYHNLSIIYSGMDRWPDVHNILSKAISYSQSLIFNQSMLTHMSLLGKMRVRAAPEVDNQKKNPSWSDWAEIEFSARAGESPRIFNPSGDIRLEYQADKKRLIVWFAFKVKPQAYLIEYELKNTVDRVRMDMKRPIIANLWNDYGIVLEYFNDTESALDAYRYANILEPLNRKISANLTRLSQLKTSNQ